MVCLSVLMPAYNAAGTVAAAVRSTLRALPPDAELLVLDDGSEDGTVEVLDRLRASDGRLRIMTAERNSGVAITLNALIDEARGRYVARMDADDICLPGRFSVQLRQVSRPEIDAIFMSVLCFGSRPAAFRPMLPATVTPGEAPYLLLLENVLPHPTLMTSRELLVDVGGYRTTPAEDYDAWLRLAARGVGMARTARPGVAYRRHGAQVSGTTAWIEASLEHGAVRQAYSALALHVLGQPPTGQPCWDRSSAVQTLRRRAREGDLPGTVRSSGLFRRALRRAARQGIGGG